MSNHFDLINHWIDQLQAAAAVAQEIRIPALATEFSEQAAHWTRETQKIKSYVDFGLEITLFPHSRLYKDMHLMLSNICEAQKKNFYYQSQHESSLASATDCLGH